MHLFHLAALLAVVSLQCAADEAPFYANSKYNDADYGPYVTQTFRSNPQVTGTPIINFMKPFCNCDDGSYLMITPRGELADATPMILDVTGSPIWASTQKYGEVYNVQVQSFQGQPYLTFWGGNDAVGGHGIGQYFMLDQQYREQYRIEAGNGSGADLHAFTITTNDTALISIYDKKIADVDSVIGHHRKGWVWDSILQELDLQTGEAVFEWRANDHIDPSESYSSTNSMTEDDPWDVYHLNSVQKDALGNYLIYVRYLRAILYIDGRTGEVLWQLGGKDNSFKDLSQGKATACLGQHDIHLLEKDGKTYITFFDNKADWEHAMDTESKGTRVEIDLEAMTAKLDLALFDPLTKILSSSQGSYQTLPNGHVVLGYGFNGAMAEFSEEGEMLCDAYFQPSSRFDTGQTASPDTVPDLVLDGKVLYMSWNGATEVDTWLLLESDADERDTQSQTELSMQNRAVEDVVIVRRTGFETTYEALANGGLKKFVRAVALDKEGRALGTSEVVDLGDLATNWKHGVYQGEVAENDKDETEPVDGEHNNLVPKLGDSHILIGFGVLAGLSFVLVLFLAIGKQKVLWPWKAAVAKLDQEKAPISQRYPVNRLGNILQRLRRLISGLRRRDDFAEAYAREGLLGDGELRIGGVPEQMSSVGVIRPDR